MILDVSEAAPENDLHQDSLGEHGITLNKSN